MDSQARLLRWDIVKELRSTVQIADALLSHANGPLHVYEMDVGAAICAAKETA